MQKIQITLTPEETNAIGFRAKKLGFSVTKYVRFLVAKEANDVVNHETVQTLSTKLENETLKALAEHKNHESYELSSFEDLDTV
ncbi:hypothetical protein COU88_02675 [Candidatus Roizmanbacteria bacterium CG10_big_fil_rev_8_21_14_0_10_39_6]|uniref:Uncharacterized protein n=1 Tax=Candidatus Roizmanbacteria bacterium CG10_big_fil_rev_8_21_14_0_10_39_6 TaxID=1974853 RepID=A0A2M8KSH6_9BACT|nr:MAG: hypothetical protein COU88_02675 [Candidatus Roizmanbacteria bacterium CG10_big_fil_rev_8_21_14_0_10_39_6]